MTKLALTTLVNLALGVVAALAQYAEDNPAVFFAGSSPGPPELFDRFKIRPMEPPKKLIGYLRFKSSRQDATCFIKGNHPALIGVNQSVFRLSIEASEIFLLEWIDEDQLVIFETIPLKVEGYPDRRWRITISLKGEPKILTIM